MWKTYFLLVIILFSFLLSVPLCFVEALVFFLSCRLLRFSDSNHVCEKRSCDFIQRTAIKYSDIYRKHKRCIENHGFCCCRRCRWRKCLNKTRNLLPSKLFSHSISFPFPFYRNNFGSFFYFSLWKGNSFKQPNAKSECNCKLEQNNMREFERCMQKSCRHTFLLIFNVCNCFDLHIFGLRLEQQIEIKLKLYRYVTNPV